MTSSPNKAAESAQLLLAPSRSLPVLDPHVQSFLDRQLETARGRDDAAANPAKGRGRKQFHPAEPTGQSAVLLYLHVPGNGGYVPDEAVQLIANAAGALLVLQTLPLEGGTDERDFVIVQALESLHDLAGHGALLLGGDDIGALVAVSFASRPIAAPFALSLLILATPMLAWPDGVSATPWLSSEAAQDRAVVAQGMLDGSGWPIEYRDDRLQRLPPLLILTAEVDPFRGGAELFARRMMAADLEVSTVQMLGSIHDFVWLPDLLDARCTKAAHALIVDALRLRTKDVMSESGAC